MLPIHEANYLLQDLYRQGRTAFAENIRKMIAVGQLEVNSKLISYLKQVA